MSNFFKRRREELGLSQRGIAQRLGVSNSAVSSWEDEIRIPTLPIASLAAGYDVKETVIEKALIEQRRAMEKKQATASSAS